MNIQLHKVSKRFDSGWVIRDLDLEIRSGDKLAIKGANGSGKSTLIQILAGYLSISKGKLVFEHGTEPVNRDDIYKYLSISTAYSELDEELRPSELFTHFRSFKDYHIEDLDEFLDLIDLKEHKNKEVKYFSSGMKQRLSLGLAICMDVPLLILDEPGSFLDQERKLWLKDMLERFCSEKTVIIASNEASDLEFCDKELELKPL